MARPKLTPFREEVWARATQIPHGKVVKYSEISGRSCANVGAALEHLVDNFDPQLPWHRVVNSDGSLSRHAMNGQKDKLTGEEVAFGPDGRVKLCEFHWTEIPFTQIP